MFDLGQLRAGVYQLSVDGEGADAHGVPQSYVESIVQFEVTDHDIKPAAGLHMCIIHFIIHSHHPRNLQCFQTIGSLVR
jgi:hypothetical protein